MKTFCYADYAACSRWLDRRIHIVRKRARLKGLKCSIGKKDLKAALPRDDMCPILGVGLEYEESGFYSINPDHFAEVDRIDTSKGYVPGNIQIISRKANRIKSDANPAELMKVALYMQRFDKTAALAA